jgi:hypothetical protein
MRGYWINPLTFTYVTATSVWNEWRKVERKNTSFARKRFYIFDLGVPYLSGEGLITRDTILRTMQASVPETGFNVLGVDQGDLLHWVVRRVLPTGRMAVVAYGVTNDFNRIDSIISLYRVRSGIIDALPNKHNARDLVQRFRGRMWMAYYKDQREERKYVTENKKREAEKRKKEQEAETSTMHLDRTETLDDSAQDWIDGMAFLQGDPLKNLSEDQENFIRQMTNMKRDLAEDSKGNTVAVWMKVGDDHYRHADNYAKSAANIYGRGRIEDLYVGGAIEGPGSKSGISISDLVPAGMDLRSTFSSLKGF